MSDSSSVEWKTDGSGEALPGMTCPYDDRITINFSNYGEFVFDPCMDITAYELAEITKMLLVLLHSKGMELPNWADLPTSITRHFRKSISHEPTKAT